MIKLKCLLLYMFLLKTCSMALPSHSLPSRALPCRALRLISEYSHSMTRPDWRKSKPIITTYKLFCVFRRRERINRKIRMKTITLLENIENTEWYWTYRTIHNYGVEKYYQKCVVKYGAQYRPNIEIDGISDAIKKYHLFYADWR